jgi:hypothetical protein
MMHTRNCEKVHFYLNNDRFDLIGLEVSMYDHVGKDEVVDITNKLEAYYGIQVHDIRMNFEMLDQRVCELKHRGGGSDMIKM